MTLKKKVRNFFKKAAINVIRNRQQKAAEELARHLIRDNRDFSRYSEADLVRAILSKKGVTLDKISG